MDQIPRTKLNLRGRSRSPYATCLFLGFAAAVVLAQVLAVLTGRRMMLICAVAAAGIGSFFLVAIITKLICGEEVLVYYHHAIVTLASAAAVVSIAGEPVLPYLDITALSIGVAIGFVRIGCLMVGCCHGRPSSWGVCYGDQHAEVGFPFWYVGVRLLPTQAMESMLVALIVTSGAAKLAAGAAPGTVLSWYLTLYAAARFALEFGRGDDGRAYLGGLSQAQLTSLVVVGLVLFCQHADGLPKTWWPGVTFGAMSAGAALTTFRAARGYLEGKPRRQPAPTPGSRS